MEGEVYGIIYKVTNKINGRMYVGQTVKLLKERIDEHVCCALNGRGGIYFHNAIKKYGKENFIWRVIAECNSMEELNKIEIKMIEKYNTFENGYNLTKGGRGKTGFKPSKETRRKQSESQKGEKNHNYGKYGKDSPNFGQTKKTRWKKKISKALVGKQVGNKSPCAKKYIITTPEGKEIFVHGIAEFCRNYTGEKLGYRNLVAVVQGKQRHHKGYKCKRLYEEML